MSTDKSWERFGRTEPYFGVLAEPWLAGAQIGTREREAFFRTGELHVDTIVSAIREFDSRFSPKRTLDFGCGTGRTTIPLARVSQQVVGADVSASMLTEARRNVAAAGLDNVELLRTDDSLGALEDRFDFIHSFVVFQHIPVTRGLRLVHKLLERLTTDGWGALHFAYAIDASIWWRMAYWTRWHVPLAHTAANVLQRQPWRRPFMQMNRYPLRQLLQLLQEHRCHRVGVRFSRHGRFLGAMLLFQRTELPQL